ncbi:MAG: chemotaxis protein CheC [Chloroflexota bacterium]|jgi:chemotaxis protein CheC
MKDPYTHEQFSEKLRPLLEVMAGEGIQNAVKGLSQMTGQQITVTEPEVTLVPLVNIPDLLGGPENEAVGVYLRAEGEMSGQIMLVFPYERALKLVDLLIDEPEGTTQHLGAYERSALAEVGNLTGSFFLNSVATMLGLEARPTPPAVMVDMVAAILDVIIATAAGVSEHVLMLSATFMQGDREAEASFWVIPDPRVLEAFLEGKN